MSAAGLGATSGAPIERVAAFDVDGTLTTRDCVVPFLRRMAGTGALAARMLRHPVGLARAGAGLDRDALKAASAAAAFSGAPVDDVQPVDERMPCQDPKNLPNGRLFVVGRHEGHDRANGAPHS